MSRILALDVGGTYIKSAVADFSDGEPRLGPVQRTSTLVGDGDALVAQLAGVAATHGDFDRVGVVTPGILDEAKGVIKYATNLKLADFDLAPRLADRVGRPVRLAHDGRAAALAELRLGAGRGFDNFVLMPIGTGISVGIVVDGRVLSSEGQAGEIGHADVGHDEVCGCGLRGCLEVFSSTSGIERRYLQAAGRAAGADEVLALASSGDAVAARIWLDATDAIALACDWLMNTLSPQSIAFAGGLSKAGSTLTDAVGAKLSTRVSFQRTPRLGIAELGDDAGCLGAALTGWELP